MKSFDAWLREQTPAQPKPDEDDLPDGLTRDSAGTLRFECWTCGRQAEFFGEPHEYDPNLREHNVGSCGPLCTP